MRKGIEVRLGPGDRERLEAMIGSGNSRHYSEVPAGGSPMRSMVTRCGQVPWNQI